MTESAARTAQNLVVEIKTVSPGAAGPSYAPNWIPLWGAKIDRIVINAGDTPSEARIWFPALRWDDDAGLSWGDRVRVRTDHSRLAGSRTTVFSGFVTGRLSDFSASDPQGKPHERNAVICKDYRWLLGATCPIFGQVTRGPDDYTDYGQESQTPISNSYIWASGRRAIFNAGGRGNRHPTDLTIIKNGTEITMPIFADPTEGVDWTARQMVAYCLSPYYNQIYNLLPIDSPAEISDLAHTDWDSVIGDVTVDGLTALEAIVLIAKTIGWSLREDYSTDGTTALVFYKLASAAGTTRSDSSPVILHSLHAPAVGEDVTVAAAAGRKLLCSATINRDISRVLNNPWGIGAPDRFEFTAELVPAWKDDDLYVDIDYPFLTDAELQDITAPNEYPYYKYHHVRGAEFRRNVGRKWSLNETGTYTGGDYGRGDPFDFSTVIDSQYIKNDDGKRIYGAFKRRLLQCLTLDDESVNSVGLKVEFSFDGGSTWQVLPGAIETLTTEAGIWIAEPNLAEMTDENEAVISDGTFVDIPLNLFSSLLTDKHHERDYSAGEWKTRVRITASVQMDQRIRSQAEPTNASGSPFRHAGLYDFSDKYGIQKRTDSSSFAHSGLSAAENDPTEEFDNHLLGLRAANEDMSVSGRFTLDRLWLGDGSGSPEFYIGDCIKEITGRYQNLSASYGSEAVYPEIVQILYLPDGQYTKLITRDLRFTETVI